jgi:hypothetical protein
MMLRYVLPLAALLSAVMVFTGCGGDGGDGGGGEPTPVTGVDVAPAQAEVEVGHILALTATVSGGDSKEVTWYVGGYPNGNDSLGTIAPGDPVTYRAPDRLPDHASAVIKVVSVEDPTKMDSSIVSLTFETVHVDADHGDDDAGTGSINLPLKTITHALTIADSGMTVLASPGIYSDAAGESYPLSIPSGVTLEGENWQTCVLAGHETEVPSIQGILLEEDRATVRKFTIRDRAQPGSGRWLAAIWVSGGSHCRIDSVRFSERSHYACIRIDGVMSGATVSTLVENCVIDVRSDELPPAGFNRGFEVIFDDVDTVIRNCSVYGFSTGISFNFSSNALVEGCTLEDNVTGAYLCCVDDDDSNPNPDFGGGARGSAGGNSFRNNTACGLNNAGTSIVYAKHNTWNNDPPVEGEDFCSEVTATIIVE